MSVTLTPVAPRRVQPVPERELEMVDVDNGQLSFDIATRQTSDTSYSTEVPHDTVTIPMPGANSNRTGPGELPNGLQAISGRVAAVPSTTRPHEAETARAGGLQQRAVRVMTPQERARESSPSFSLSQIANSRQVPGLATEQDLADTSRKPSLPQSISSAVKSKKGLLLLAWWVFWVLAYLLCAFTLAQPAQRSMDDRLVTTCTVTSASISAFRVGVVYDLSLGLEFTASDGQLITTEVVHRHIDSDTYIGSKNLQDFRVGKELQCFYQENRPESVVLEHAVTGEWLTVHVLFPIIGVMTFALSLVLLISHWRAV